MQNNFLISSVSCFLVNDSDADDDDDDDDDDNDSDDLNLGFRIKCSFCLIGDVSCFIVMFEPG